MALAFRPRIGPVVWYHNPYKRGVFSTLLAAGLVVGFVWPLQLCWWIVKAMFYGIAILVVALVLTIQRHSNSGTQARM